MVNDIKINSRHNNAKRLEYFLNRVQEPLAEVPLEWSKWKLSQGIEDGYRFVSSASDPVNITVLLCSSYGDALQIAQANDLTVLPTAKWSVNGDLLFFVESENVEKVSDLLGLFAGEE